MNDKIKEKGFKSEIELIELVNKIDLSDNIKFQKFSDWKQNDGTKQGLIDIG